MLSGRGDRRLVPGSEDDVDDLLGEYRRAVMFFDAGDPAGAARLLEPILAAEPDHADVRLLLARAYFHSAQLTRAEEQLRALVERDPSDHYARFVLGRTLERQSRPAEALPHLRMASAMHPSEEYEETVKRVAAKVR
jgi:cytochrome c-type biogenesis protein CcmH/NrfG